MLNLNVFLHKITKPKCFFYVTLQIKMSFDLMSFDVHDEHSAEQGPHGAEQVGLVNLECQIRLRKVIVGICISFGKETFFES